MILNSGFETFSVQHFSVLFVSGIITYALIHKGRAADEPLKTNIGLVMAGLTFSSLLIEVMVKLADGTYDILTDLPLFLCDLVAVMLPFILFAKSRKWIGILYFWAMAGTLQALLTPELEEGFPSFHFFRYFFTHAGIVAAVLYTIIVSKIRIDWRDFLNAIIYAQFYIVGIHLVNQMIGSNYSYTIAKPQSATILDLLGDWPWYIFWGEMLMILLFLLFILPFVLIRIRRAGDPQKSTRRFEDN